MRPRGDAISRPGDPVRRAGREAQPAGHAGDELVLVEQLEGHAALRGVGEAPRVQLAGRVERGLDPGRNRAVRQRGAERVEARGAGLAQQPTRPRPRPRPAPRRRRPRWSSATCTVPTPPSASQAHVRRRRAAGRAPRARPGAIDARPAVRPGPATRGGPASGVMSAARLLARDVLGVAFEEHVRSGAVPREAGRPEQERARSSAGVRRSCAQRATTGLGWVRSVTWTIDAERARATRRPGGAGRSR